MLVKGSPGGTTFKRNLSIGCFRRLKQLNIIIVFYIPNISHVLLYNNQFDKITIPVYSNCQSGQLVWRSKFSNYCQILQGPMNYIFHSLSAINGVHMHHYSYISGNVNAFFLRLTMINLMYASISGPNIEAWKSQSHDQMAVLIRWCKAVFWYKLIVKS